MTLGTRSSGLRRLIASVVCVAGLSSAGLAAAPASRLTALAGVNGYASAAELNVLGTPGS